MASSIMSIIIVVVLHLAIFAIIYIIFKYSIKDSTEKMPLEKEEFQKLFGTLIEGLRIKGGWIPRYWNCLVLVRWSLTIIIMVVMRDYV
jgi:ABC-type maltose transport system permease subunit